MRKFVQVHAEYPAHGLEETSRSGGALVVHGKLPHRAVIGNGDGLHVLSADIHDGLDGRVAPECAHGVAADLRDVLIGKRHFVSPVARANEVGQVLCIANAWNDCAGLLQGLSRRNLRIDLAWNDAAGNHVTFFIQDDRFAGGGAHVASAKIFFQHILLPLII